MKLFIKVSIALVFATTFISWLNCNSHNPAAIDLNDPRTFPGKYNLVSLTEKFGGGFGQLTYIAGERTTVTTPAGSKFVTVTGRLKLTETTYLISFTTKTETAFGERTDTTSSTGTYQCGRPAHDFREWPRRVGFREAVARLQRWLLSDIRVIHLSNNVQLPTRTRFWSMSGYWSSSQRAKR